jgi:predicted metal-dependent hydrolase
MNQQDNLSLISKYLSRFKEQVKILNKNGEFSINIHAENILIKILNILFDASFENVNYIDGKNYDSIDLQDKSKKIGIQITATSTISKVKDTLKTYIKNKN